MKYPIVHALCAMLLLGAGSAQAGVYKCVENGETHFSDKPCATKEDRQTGRLDSKPAITIGSQNGAAAPSHTGSVIADVPLPGPIYFGNDPSERLSRAMALLQTILADGQNCDAAMKSAPKDVKTTIQCQNFLLEMRDGAQWPQTVATIKDLAADPRFVQDNIEPFRQSRHINDDLNVLWKSAKLAMIDK